MAEHALAHFPLNGAQSGLIGSSAVMEDCRKSLERIASSESTVLLQGETGTGKDLAARFVHQHSSRRGKPFVVVDCGAITETLLESELFGHVKGAFTGASSDRLGAFRAAEGGTVFLDELGEMPIRLQSALLRCLEARAVRPVGSSEYQPIDVRVIAATHRSVEADVAAGRFRQDLYYRVAVITIAMPALRHRPEDLAELIRHFGGRQARFLLEKEALEAALLYNWPGNVRELKNYVERSVVRGEVSPLAVQDNEFGCELDLDTPLRQLRERWTTSFEKRYLAGLLVRANGNVANAARLAGVNRTYLYRLLGKHHMQP